MAGHEDNTLDAETLALFADAPEKLVKKLRKEGDCVVWTGARQTTKLPYGQVWIAPRMWAAHRLAYETCVGPIPDGLIVRHSCDNPPCCNPNHLQLGTHKDNAYDRKVRGREAKGDSHGMSKLTEAYVRDIKARMAQGETHLSLSRAYGVAESTISGISTGRLWGWVTDAVSA